MALQREVAHRVFAQEFNQSRHQIPGQGEKDPSFLVTPLGAKVNRLHVVGVCTDVEPVGDSGEVFRARISDPTGVFTVYAGQYQPEAANVLSNLQPPQYVAVTGKARTYEPEPGSVFVSIRPETIQVVDQATRDQWILRTAKRSIERLRTAQAVRQDPHIDRARLGEGRRALDAEGALLAQEAYGLTDIDRFGDAVRDALQYLRDGEVPVHRVESREPEAGAPAAPPQWKPDESTEEVDDALDDTVLAHVQRLEGESGANWEDVLREAAVQGTTSEHVEEALNRLMDKGLVYEPTLGVLRTT